MAHKVFTYKERVIINERASYEPTWPTEQFIVPLLKRHIEDNMYQFALPIYPNSKILDIGCGKQPFRKDFEKLGYTYYGLDTQVQQNIHVDYICSIDAPLPDALLAAGSFDFILCTEVLEHVADWQTAFENFHILLREGGKILITCPHFYQLHEEPYDFWRPTIHALNIFAKNYNFKVLKSEKLGSAWDILGTFLANCHPYSNSPGILDRIKAFFYKKVKEKLLHGLIKGTIQKNIKLGSPLYLSNIFILQR